ncbi:MAG TPA: Imm8 family immunity protein [Polyangiaceae bacterium]|nr:Imm8 family immunity protein [Polyangiaceae bacterium]
MSRRTRTRKGEARAPVLKSFDCSEIDDIESWVPASSAVCYWLTLSIGAPDSDGADNFQVCVAMPDGLKSPEGRRIKPKGNQPAPIVVQEYSWAEVLREIERRLNACAGRNWAEMQEGLRLQMNWEYEDYKP